MIATPEPPFGDQPNDPTAPNRLQVYRQEELEWHPNTQIILFDSPAATDAGQKLLPKNLCLGWSGVRQEIELHDWTPISGREFLIWPGASHRSSDANGSLARRFPGSVMLRTPPDWQAPGGHGADMANWLAAGATQQEAETWLARERTRIEDEYEAIRIAENNATPPPSVEDPQDLHPIANDVSTWPFRLLGYDEGVYYYLPEDTQQIVGLAAIAHNEPNFGRLAPFGFWSQVFPKGDPGSAPSWSKAREAMLRMQADVGPFSTSVTRGRGCWVDGGSVVFHAGNQLLVKNSPLPLNGLKSPYIYPRSLPLKPDSAKPLIAAEASKFLRLCDSLSWTAPLYGRLLAGWCMAATVCGALDWRPHIWVTGPSGSGKTFTISTIVHKFLDRFAFKAQSNSTEAGIRQAIKSDAIAIVFDEAESEDERSRMRMKGVLDLVRQSSSESGAAIFKGSSTGNAIEFRVRSCFCFSSIGVAAVSRADTSRITVLSMHNRNHNTASFEKIKDLARETVLNELYVSALRARAIDLAKEIRENSKLFAVAVSLKLGDARAGDQLGALLAGAFALTSSKLITPDAARTWVDSQDWSNFAVAKDDRDENRAVSTLAEYAFRVDEDRSSFTTSVGNLLGEYYDLATADGRRDDITHHLLLIGIKPTRSHIDISSSHTGTAKIFRDTPWAGKWKDQMMRSSPAAIEKQSAKFGASFTRAVRLPPQVFGLEPLPTSAPLVLVPKVEEANTQAQLVGVDF